MCIWTRPNLKEFIDFLDKNVKYISIWTNGTFSWLYYVLNNILSKYVPKKRFLLLLSVDYSIKQQITNNGMTSMIPIKNIEEMIKRFPNNNISLYNTVLIDDNYYNCIYNRNNTIPIKKYFALEEVKGIRNNDLMFIIQIIMELKKSKNVQKTLKGVYNGITDYNRLFSIVY
jgi:nitrogen fixation protein